MSEENTEVTEGETGEVVEEVAALDICTHYASSYERVCKDSPDLMEILVAPTELKAGKEAFMVFRYGTKRFKASFEQVERVRKPKEAKNGATNG